MAKKPHIVIFNPDQWRGDVLGHVGNPAAVTPNLDRLAQTDAVSFTRTFCQNPVCTPSRCSFMTGWYPHTRGHRTMYHMLHPERGETNLLKVLKDDGYFVWWGGKNDLVPGQDGSGAYCDVYHRPADDDYARWGIDRQEGQYEGDMAWRGKNGSDTYFSFFKGKLEKGDQPYYGDSDWAHVLGAIELLHDYEGDKPLCIYLPLEFPHPPYCVEEPWFSMIERDKLPPRRKPPDDWSRKPSILGEINRRQRLNQWNEARWRELRATYYGMCSRVDHQLGLIVEALKKTGRYDDTALFFFSDHGDYTGDYNIVEKTQNTFDDCLTRVPLVIKPPKNIPVKPRTCEALTELIDFTATAYELAGLDPGYSHFGTSLVPLLTGAADTNRDAVFCEGGRRAGEQQAMEAESVSASDPDGLYAPRVQLQQIDQTMYHTKAAMCRTQTHKYVMRMYEDDELYDLVNDPDERHNLIHDPSAQQLAGSLRERLLAWYMETCDIVPQATDLRHLRDTVE